MGMQASSLSLRLSTVLCRICCTSALLLLTPRIMKYCSLQNIEYMRGGRRSFAVHQQQVFGNRKNSIEDVIDSFKMDIEEIVEQYIERNITQPDLSVLLENAHVITKGRLYEEVISERLGACSNNFEVERVQKVDEMLKSFILSERKSRCRLKVNYLMAGASSKRLEQSIAMLSESDEIDEDLLRYIENLIRREQIRAVGPLAALDKETVPIIEGKTEKMVIDILTMILKRLQAELATSDRPEIRLLADLLQEEDIEQREALLRLSLKKLEDFEIFDSFLQDGISHLSASLQNRDVASIAISQAQSMNGGASNAGNILARMRDIKQSIEIMRNRFKTGMNDESDVFSTASDDYNA